MSLLVHNLKRRCFSDGQPARVHNGVTPRLVHEREEVNEFKKLGRKWDEADKVYEINESLKRIKELLIDLRDNI